MRNLRALLLSAVLVINSSFVMVYAEEPVPQDDETIQTETESLEEGVQEEETVTEEVTETASETGDSVMDLNVSGRQKRLRIRNP